MAVSSALRLTLITAGVSIGREALSGQVAGAGGPAGKAILNFPAAREFGYLVIRALDQAARFALKRSPLMGWRFPRPNWEAHAVLCARSNWEAVSTFGATGGSII